MAISESSADPGTIPSPPRLRWRGPRTIYAASLLAAQGLNGISALLIFRWIDPLVMGWWSSAQLLKVALDALRMGVLSGMSREYPYLVGRDRNREALEVVETGLAHSLIMIVVGLVLSAGVAAWFGSTDVMFGIALIVAGLSWALTYYTNYVRATFRSSSSFIRLGTMELGLAAFGVVTLLLVWQFSFDGLLVRTLLVAVVGVLVFFTYRPFQVRPHLRRWAVIETFRFGRHTYLTGYMLLLGQNAERILLLSATDGVRMVGLYSPALAAASILQVIPGAIHASSYPALLETFGRDQDAPKLLRMLLRQIRRTALAMIGISSATAAFLAILIHFGLPKYSEALLPAMIACASGPFLALRMLSTYYNALKCWPEYYTYIVAQSVLPYAFIVLLMVWMPPLLAAATGYFLSVAVSSILMLILTIMHARRTAATT